MKKVKPSINDELRPEYDLKSLRVRQLGPARKGFGVIIRLEPDVQKAFPDSESVNSALRELIRRIKNDRKNSRNSSRKT